MFYLTRYGLLTHAGHTLAPAMEHRVISFRASDVESTKLLNISSTYFAHEQARNVCQLLIGHFRLDLRG